LTYAGVTCAHASIDLLNDYADYKSSIDIITIRTPLSGGTGVLPEGLLQPRAVYRAGIFLLGCATIIGLVLTIMRGYVVGALLVFGILSVYFYSTKIANYGFGEVLLVVKGTLIVVGTYYVQSLAFAAPPLLAGVIMGLLSSSALYVNQFPDYNADKQCGRRNLVVRLGLRNAAKAYVIYPMLSYSILTIGVRIGDIPILALFSVVALPFFYKTFRRLTVGKFDNSSLFPAMTQNVFGARIMGVIITLAYLIAA